MMTKNKMGFCENVKSDTYLHSVFPNALHAIFLAC